MIVGMNARILDGSRHAADIRRELQERIHGGAIRPNFAIVLVGDDGASLTYVNMKRERASEVGIASDYFHFDADAPESAVRDALSQAAAETRMHGIMVQLPLPSSYDKESVLSLIPPEKDVDGHRFLALEKPVYVPATVEAVLTLLEREEIDVAGRVAAVVGAKGEVGRPLAVMLERLGADVRALDREHAETLAEHTRAADVLVSTVGKPGLITPAHVKPGAVVVDVGFRRIGQRSYGDVAPEVAEVASAISPVPGGVGPLTIASLLAHVVDAAERQTD